MSVIVKTLKSGEGDPFIPEILSHQEYHPKMKAKQNFLNENWENVMQRHWHCKECAGSLWAEVRDQVETDLHKGVKTTSLVCVSRCNIFLLSMTLFKREALN